MTDKELFLNVKDLREDSVYDIMEVLEKIGAADLTRVKSLTCSTGKILYVKDQMGKEYYIGLGYFGFVEIVREGAFDGKIVYVARDD